MSVADWQSDASMRMMDILYVCVARDLRRLLGLESLAPHEGLVRALEQERQERVSSER